MAVQWCFLLARNVYWVATGDRLLLLVIDVVLLLFHGMKSTAFPFCTGSIVNLVLCHLSL